MIRRTLIPEGLVDDLVADGLGLMDVFGRTFLLDLCVVVLDIATVLVESSHLELLFNAGQVDGGHGIFVGKNAPRNGGQGWLDIEVRGGRSGGGQGQMKEGGRSMSSNNGQWEVGGRW